MNKPEEEKELNLREEFESVINTGQHHYDLAKKENGQYADKTTYSMWKGFKLYHRQLQRKALEKVDNTLGRYVIGSVNEQGHLFMSTNPYRHSSLKKAREEIKRLQTMFPEKQFAVMRCLEVHPAIS